MAKKEEDMLLGEKQDGRVKEARFEMEYYKHSMVVTAQPNLEDWSYKIETSKGDVSIRSIETPTPNTAYMMCARAFKEVGFGIYER